MDNFRWTTLDERLSKDNSQRVTLDRWLRIRPDQSRSQYKIRVFIGFVNVDRRLIQGFR